MQAIYVKGLAKHKLAEKVGSSVFSRARLGINHTETSISLPGIVISTGAVSVELVGERLALNGAGQTPFGLCNVPLSLHDALPERRNSAVQENTLEVVVGKGQGLGRITGWISSILGGIDLTWLSAYPWITTQAS